MLMRPGDHVEVWTFNTVASVRGTDFMVETVERPVQAGAFGLLGVREVSQAVGDGVSPSRETVVVTISGLVDVANPLAGTGRAERIGAYEAVRVSGRQDPIRFQVSANELRVLLKGLTPPRPQEARSGDRAAAVAEKVEQVAQAVSSQSARGIEQVGGDVLTRGNGGQGDQDNQSPSSAGGQSSQSSGKGSGAGLALGQVNGGGSGAGLALGQVNGGGSGTGHTLGHRHGANRGYNWYYRDRK
jgi:hypothetical protein